MGGLLTGCAPSFFIHLGGGERGEGEGEGGGDRSRFEMSVSFNTFTNICAQSYFRYWENVKEKTI